MREGQSLKSSLTRRQGSSHFGSHDAGYQWLDFSLFGPAGAACPMLVGGFWMFSHPSDFEQLDHTAAGALQRYCRAGLVRATRRIQRRSCGRRLTIGELAALDGLLTGVAHIYN